MSTGNEIYPSGCFQHSVYFTVQFEQLTNIIIHQYHTGIDWLMKCLFCQHFHLKKVTLTKLVNVNVNVNVADMIKDARKVLGIMYLNTMFCKDRYQISSRSGYVSYINYERE